MINLQIPWSPNFFLIPSRKSFLQQLFVKVVLLLIFPQSITLYLVSIFPLMVLTFPSNKSVEDDVQQVAISSDLLLRHWYIIIMLGTRCQWNVQFNSLVWFYRHGVKRNRSPWTEQLLASGVAFLWNSKRFADLLKAINLPHTSDSVAKIVQITMTFANL